MNPRESLKYSVILVVDIKGLISDVRSTSEPFIILRVIRQIGSEVEERIFEQNTTEFPVSVIMVMRC
jgi:hypothetical protein